MVQIVIVEPHPLLRLGIAGLMGSLTSADQIRSHCYDTLYHSPPPTIAADLVLLGAPAEERITFLIQAACRAYSPRRLVLMSESPTLPPRWANLPTLVCDYICSNSSAESILATFQTLIQPRPRHSPRSHFVPGMSGHGKLPDHIGAAATYYPHRVSQPDLPFIAEVNEARMLGLSPRQYEVLVLLAQGFPIKQISRQLNISIATTKGHLEALYQRLRVHSRYEAVFVALARGATLELPALSLPSA